MRALLALVVAGAAVAATSCGWFADDPEPGEVVGDDDVVLEAGGATWSGWRVRYGSVGADGDATTVSGVVAVPDGDPPAGGWPILAWGHETVGAADRCAPSADENLGALARSVAPFLDAGYVVAATDYEGIGTDGSHPYLHGPSAGRTMTDAVRAARSVEPRTSNRWVAAGHSQGGHAALFAAEVGPAHAPELDLLGVAALAPASDPGGLLSSSLGDALFEALLVAGWLAAEPDVDDDVLTDAGEDAVDAVEEECDVVTDGDTLAGGHDAFAEYLVANQAGHAATDVPILVVQGGGDDLVTPAMSRDLLERVCAAGGTIELVEQRRADHLSVIDSGVPVVLDWLADRLAGAPAPSAC